jgi:hypothetical protein
MALRHVLKFACSRHHTLVEDVAEYLARSVAFHDERQRKLHAFYLGRRIAEKMAGGHLPLKRPAIVHGGPSNGVGYCDACERSLDRRQLVMNVPTAFGTVVRLHADCFLLWDDVRRRL